MCINSEMIDFQFQYKRPLKNIVCHFDPDTERLNRTRRVYQSIGKEITFLNFSDVSITKCSNRRNLCTTIPFIEK